MFLMMCVIQKSLKCRKTCYKIIFCPEQAEDISSVYLLNQIFVSISDLLALQKKYQKGQEPTYCTCILSCFVDKKIAHSCFCIDKIKKHIAYSNFFDVLLETYFIFLALYSVWNPATETSKQCKSYRMKMLCWNHLPKHRYTAVVNIMQKNAKFLISHFFFLKYFLIILNNSCFLKSQFLLVGFPNFWIVSISIFNPWFTKFQPISYNSQKLRSGSV